MFLKVSRLFLLVLFLSGLTAALSGCGLISNSRLVFNNSVLWQDEFRLGNTGNWLTEGDVSGQAVVLDEALIIQVHEPFTGQYAALQDPLFDDFVVEVDATQLEGSLNSSYGLLFRVQDNQQFYRFDITGNGKYIVEKRVLPGEWVRLSNGWVDTDAVLTGLETTNRLRVEADGDALKFYVNNNQVFETEDSSYPSGMIAVDAATFNQGGLLVAFDNVLVTRP